MSHQRRIESVESLIEKARALLENAASQTLDQLKQMHTVIKDKIVCLHSKRDSHLLDNDIQVLKLLKLKIKRLIYDLSLKQKSFQ